MTVVFQDLTLHRSLISFNLKTSHLQKQTIAACFSFGDWLELRVGNWIEMDDMSYQCGFMDLKME